jgi:hypothetical protein
LQNQARRDFKYSETLMAWLVPFERKEVAEKETAKEATEKDAAENPVAWVIFIMSYFYF